MKASPWISIMDGPLIAFGNSGPNLSKLRNQNEIAMPFHVGQIALHCSNKNILPFLHLVPDCHIPLISSSVEFNVPPALKL